MENLVEDGFPRENIVYGFIEKGTNLSIMLWSDR
jgi:hypothetical protein